MDVVNPAEAIDEDLDAGPSPDQFTTSKGINVEGKPFNYTMVWEKQSGDQSGIDATISTHSSPTTPTKPKPGKQ